MFRELRHQVTVLVVLATDDRETASNGPSTRVPRLERGLLD
jgi:hypothetical protein